MILLLFFSLVPSFLTAAEPEWWAQVKNPGQVQTDFAAVAAGQLKNMAVSAMQTMDARSYGAGEDIHNLVENWRGSFQNNDYAAINAGQLKAVAKKFYDRLAVLGMKTAGQYPWQANGDNNAAVNVGQLKHVFSFDLPQITPVVTIESGDNQSFVAGQTAPLPLVVKVGGPQQAALVGWSITFIPDFGEVSGDQVTWGSSITVSTGAQGLATVYYRGPAYAADAVIAVSLADGSKRMDFHAATGVGSYYHFTLATPTLSLVNGTSAALTGQLWQHDVLTDTDLPVQDQEGLTYTRVSGSGVLDSTSAATNSEGTVSTTFHQTSGTSVIRLKAPAGFAAADGEDAHAEFTIHDTPPSGSYYFLTANSSPLVLSPGEATRLRARLSYHNATTNLDSPVSGAHIHLTSDKADDVSLSTDATGDVSAEWVANDPVPVLWTFKAQGCQGVDGLDAVIQVNVVRPTNPCYYFAATSSLSSQMAPGSIKRLSAVLAHYDPYTNASEPVGEESVVASISNENGTGSPSTFPTASDGAISFQYTHGGGPAVVKFSAPGMAGSNGLDAKIEFAVTDRTAYYYFTTASTDLQFRLGETKKIQAQLMYHSGEGGDTPWSGPLPNLSWSGNIQSYFTAINGEVAVNYTFLGNPEPLYLSAPDLVGANGESTLIVFHLTKALPVLMDTDGDRVPDVVEVQRATDPSSRVSSPNADAVVDASMPSDATLHRYATLQEAYDSLPADTTLALQEFTNQPFSIIRVKGGLYDQGVDGTAVPKKVVWLPAAGSEGKVVVKSTGTAFVITDDAVVDGFMILGDAGTPGAGIIVRPNLYHRTGEVRVVNTIVAGRGGADEAQAGGVLQAGDGELWLVNDTFVDNAGWQASAVASSQSYNVPHVHMINCIVGPQATGSASPSILGNEYSLDASSSIITGMQGVCGSRDEDPHLTQRGGHLTSASTACFAQGVTAYGTLVDIHGQSRPASGGAPDVGAEQWVDSDSNGLPDWYKQLVVEAVVGTTRAQVLGSSDYDGDGLTTAQEYGIGTHPAQKPLISHPGGGTITVDSGASSEPTQVQVKDRLTQWTMPGSQIHVSADPAFGSTSNFASADANGMVAFGFQAAVDANGSTSLSAAVGTGPFEAKVEIPLDVSGISLERDGSVPYGLWVHRRNAPVEGQAVGISIVLGAADGATLLDENNSSLGSGHTYYTDATGRISFNVGGPLAPGVTPIVIAIVGSRTLWFNAPGGGPSLTVASGRPSIPINTSVDVSVWYGIGYNTGSQLPLSNPSLKAYVKTADGVLRETLTPSSVGSDGWIVFSIPAGSVPGVLSVVFDDGQQNAMTEVDVEGIELLAISDKFFYVPTDHWQTDPITVRLVEDGEGIADVEVTFTGGRLATQPGLDEGSLPDHLTVHTDTDGYASVYYYRSPLAPLDYWGTELVTASWQGLTQVFDFRANPLSLDVVGGGGQVVAPGGVAALPLEVSVTDVSGEPFPDELTFTATGGEISTDQTNWSSTMALSADGAGIGHVYFRAASTAGTGTVLVTALGVSDAVTFSLIVDNVVFERVDATNRSVPVGTLQPVRVKVTRASNGQGISGRDVAYNLSSSVTSQLCNDANNPYGADHMFVTNVDGVAEAYVRMPAADDQTANVSATYENKDSIGFDLIATASLDPALHTTADAGLSYVATPQMPVWQADFHRLIESSKIPVPNLGTSGKTFDNPRVMAESDHWLAIQVTDAANSGVDCVILYRRAKPTDHWTLAGDPVKLEWPVGDSGRYKFQTNFGMKIALQEMPDGTATIAIAAARKAPVVDLETLPSEDEVASVDVWRYSLVGTKWLWSPDTPLRKPLVLSSEIFANAADILEKFPDGATDDAKESFKATRRAFVGATVPLPSATGFSSYGSISSMAIWGDFLALGVPDSSVAGSQSSAGNKEGIVFLFKRTAASTWTCVASLDPNNALAHQSPPLDPAAAYHRFGTSLAFNDHWLAIGATSSDPAYIQKSAVFLVRNVTGTGPVTLTAPIVEPSTVTGPALRTFGSSVALMGDVVIIGAPVADTLTVDPLMAGRVYTFSQALNLQNCTTVLNSSTITCTSTSGLAVGMPVMGASLPATATVTAVAGDGVTFTISPAATKAGTLQTLTAVRNAPVPWWEPAQRQGDPWFGAKIGVTTGSIWTLSQYAPSGLLRDGSVTSPAFVTLSPVVGQASLVITSEAPLGPPQTDLSSSSPLPAIQADSLASLNAWTGETKFLKDFDESGAQKVWGSFREACIVKDTTPDGTVLFLVDCSRAWERKKLANGSPSLFTASADIVPPATTTVVAGINASMFSISPWRADNNLNLCVTATKAGISKLRPGMNILHCSLEATGQPGTFMELALPVYKQPTIFAPHIRPYAPKMTDEGWQTQVNAIIASWRNAGYFVMDWTTGAAAYTVNTPDPGWPGGVLPLGLSYTLEMTDSNTPTNVDTVWSVVQDHLTTTAYAYLPPRSMTVTHQLSFRVKLVDSDNGKVFTSDNIYTAVWDTDNDQLPDWYEKMVNNGGSTTSVVGTADTDNDGFTTVSEYTNNTDPLNWNSGGGSGDPPPAAATFVLKEVRTRTAPPGVADPKGYYHPEKDPTLEFASRLRNSGHLVRVSPYYYWEENWQEYRGWYQNEQDLALPDPDIHLPEDDLLNPTHFLVWSTHSAMYEPGKASSYWALRDQGMLITTPYFESPLEVGDSEWSASKLTHVKSCWEDEGQGWQWVKPLPTQMDTVVDNARYLAICAPADLAAPTDKLFAVVDEKWDIKGNLTGNAYRVPPDVPGSDVTSAAEKKVSILTFHYEPGTPEGLPTRITGESGGIVTTIKLASGGNVFRLRAPTEQYKLRRVKLVPFETELYSDLNNDGTIDSADASLVGKPYVSGASSEEKSKGTEYMFVNDEISNGAHDREDTTTSDPSEDDDDAKGIHIKVGIDTGKVWLDHPAIDALSFYKHKSCYPGDKLRLTAADPFDLEDSEHLPETIYARCDGELNVPANNPQSIGDLILKYLPKSGGHYIQLAKTRVVVVKELGSTEHYQTAMDYINENNTSSYTGKSTRKGTLFDRSTYYTVMFQSRTQLYGVNAGTKSLKGITAVKDSADWKTMTAIINATYNNDNTNDHGFVKNHLGEQYIRGYTDPATGTHWDQTCSVKGDPIIYLAYGGSGVFANGSGHVPVTASDGSGALRPEAGIAHSPEGYTLVAFLQASNQKLIVVASSEWSVMSDETAGKFHDKLKKGTTSATIIHCDGGRNVALATANASGTGMVTRIEGPAQQGFPTTLYPKTFLAFKATNPRP